MKAKKTTKRAQKKPPVPGNRTKKQSRGKPWRKGESGNPATQFQPGRSGNPSGRPRDTITPHLREIAQETDKDGRSYGRRVAETLYAEALAGNVQAAREILQRLDGLPRQGVDLSIDDQRANIIGRAVERLMSESGISRQKAVAQLSAIAPEIQWE